MTKTITPDHTPLVVRDFTHDGIIAVNPIGETLEVPRRLVFAPELYCMKCGRRAIAKHDKKRNKDYAECPYHAKHMYDALYAAAKDVKRYNRHTRRQFRDQAQKWLRNWRSTAKSRLNMTGAEIINQPDFNKFQDEFESYFGHCCQNFDDAIKIQNVRKS